MKRFLAGVLSGFVLAASFVSLAQEKFYRGKKVFIRVAEEKLRAEPDGALVATVLRGTPLVVLQQSDRWLRVAANGYVLKESVTTEEGALRGQPYRAFMILVATEAEAQAILQELRAGGDFQTLARRKSTAPNKDKGGDLGEAYPGDFSTEFEQVILALKVGETSGVVKTSLGYQIFKRVR